MAVDRHRPSMRMTIGGSKRRGGFTCSLKTLWRAVRRRRLTFKKKSLHADQRDRPEVQQKRRAFRRKVREIEPKRLVFVDETGITTAMTPAYAWAPRGGRAVDSAPASWETTTLIAALGLQGGACPAGLPGSDRHDGVPDVGRSGAGAGVASRRRGGLR